jgi:microcompartment protein CcmK/EutM
MKSKGMVSVLSLTAVSLIAAGSFAQQPAQQPTQAQGTTQASNTVMFGRIVKSSGEYVLVESGSKAHYRLDDQKRGKHYSGRTVAITGIVDSNSKSIHVQKIEVAA